MAKVFDQIFNSVKDFFSEDLSDYVCVIGAANIDIVGSSPVLKANESNIGKVSISPGGVGRNVAENLSRLGIPTVFVSAIGNDYFGNLILNSLRDAGVYINGVRKVDNKNTGSYLAILDDFRSMSSAINDMGITNYVDKDWIENCSGLISGANSLVLDCNLKHEAIEEIINIANGKIYVDAVSMAKSSRIVPYLKNVWGLKPNIYEAEAITGIKINSREDAARALDYFIESGVKKPLITMDADGVMASNEDKIIHYLSKKVRPVNSTGAGDAFLAMWVASEFRGNDFSESIKNSMVASIKTMASMDTVSKDLSYVNFEKWKKEVEIYETVFEN